jgi:hypothetical protein
MLVKPEGKRKEGSPKMRWMDCVEKDLRDLGVIKWKTRAHKRDSWRKFFRASQDTQRAVVPIILIIIIIIIILIK